MKVVALSPYHGGSHRQFFEHWMSRSRHSWTLLDYPARHFKWRIRQAAVGFAERLANGETEATFDAIFCTSLLDAAELRGLLPRAHRCLPLIVYFHENQFSYPVRQRDERDVHFGLINWASALAADGVWFNSEYNRQTFLSGARGLLRKMPDHRSLHSLQVISEKSTVEPPCIEFESRPRRQPGGPMRLGWVARWEHDKRPDLFFSAMQALKERGLDFELVLLGQRFAKTPPELEALSLTMGQSVVHCGYLEKRSDYLDQLATCDVVVSTADHEFFGIALLEAASLGCLPLVPERLVYPEIFPPEYRYDGTVAHLVNRVCELARRKNAKAPLDAGSSERLSALVAPYDARTRVPQLDAALDRDAGQRK